MYVTLNMVLFALLSSISILSCCVVCTCLHHVS
jgi:hypothetical protein